MAPAECRHRHLLDVGQEELAVDRSVEDAGRLEPIVTQDGKEGQGALPAEGLAGLQDRSSQPQQLHRPTP